MGALVNTCLKGYVNYRLKPLTVSYQLAMFSDCWSSAKGDIKYMSCDLTKPRNYGIK